MNIDTAAVMRKYPSREAAQMLHPSNFDLVQKHQGDFARVYRDMFQGATV